MVINGKETGYTFFHFYKLGRSGAIWKTGYGMAKKTNDPLFEYSSQEFLDEHNKEIKEISHEDYYKINDYK